MKRFRNLFLIILCVCFCFMAGCEAETKLRTAHISEITGALSTDYGIKVVLDKDDRVADKFVDLQIKSSEAEQVLTFGEERGTQYSICLPKSEYWYNLTYLISKTNGVSDESGYQNYEDYGNKVFLFSADNDVNLTFRVVTGDVKKNTDSGEEILVLSEDISTEVTVAVKKHKKK